MVSNLQIGKDMQKESFGKLMKHLIIIQILRLQISTLRFFIHLSLIHVQFIDANVLVMTFLLNQVHVPVQSPCDLRALSDFLTTLSDINDGTHSHFLEIFRALSYHYFLR